MARGDPACQGSRIGRAHAICPSPVQSVPQGRTAPAWGSFAAPFRLPFPGAEWAGQAKAAPHHPARSHFPEDADGGTVIGFIPFKPTKFTSWFFEETGGFIREFWISDANRNAGHGSALLRLPESSFREHGMYASILTIGSAERFCRKHGYRKAPGCEAKNGDSVFVKQLAES